MSVRSMFVRLAAVAALGCGGAAARADDGYAGPAMPLCESCQHGAVRAACDVCGKLLGSNLHKMKHKKDPYPVTLCPGACFGYFQTQWRKWDEVCPYPYLGTGVSDAARPVAPSANPRPLGTGLDAPRTLDKTMPEPKKSDLPSIPTPGGNKFGP